MTLVLALLIILLPLSAFAGDPRSLHRPHSYNDPSEGVLVIPDGHGGVQYFRGQGGTDAYTAGVIGQGLTQQFKQTHIPPPVYTKPALELPETPRQTYNDQAVHDRMYEFLSGR